MNFSPIQWVFVVIFGFSLVRLFFLIQKGGIPRVRGFTWMLIWGGGLIFVLRPELSTQLASRLGVARGTDAVVYSAIAFLSVLVFRLFRLVDEQDRHISELTTALTIRDWATHRNEPPEAAAPVLPDA